MNRYAINVIVLPLCLFCYSAIVIAADFDAVLDWSRKSKLSTPVSGVVAIVNVNPGDRVNTGDVLVQLDNNVLKAKMEKAKADVEHFEQLYSEAERELERNVELYDRTVLSDHELEVAKIAFADSNARLKNAEAMHAQAEFNFKYSEIRAPFNGVVIRRNVHEGETIVSQQQAPTMIELAEADVMVAQVQMTSAQIRNLSVGKKAVVRVGKARYDGVVSAVGFEPISKSNKKYKVEVEFNTKGKLYRAGRAAKVSMP